MQTQTIRSKTGFVTIPHHETKADLAIAKNRLLDLLNQEHRALQAGVAFLLHSIQNRALTSQEVRQLDAGTCFKHLCTHLAQPVRTRIAVYVEAYPTLAAFVTAQRTRNHAQLLSTLTTALAAERCLCR